jgi:hypothetical protein
MRSESSFCMILCGSSEGSFRKNSRSLKVVLLQVYSFLPHPSLRFWNRQTFTVRHWTNSWWYILALFLFGNPLLNRRHHTEVGVCEVSALLIHWAVIHSHEIPSLLWKQEPIINS